MCLLQAVRYTSWWVLMDFSINTARLLSFTKLNLLCIDGIQIWSFIPDRSGTFVLLPCLLFNHLKWKLPTLHSSYFAWITSLLTNPNSWWPPILGKIALCLSCFGYDCKSYEELFTVSHIARQHPGGIKKKQRAILLTLWKYIYSRLWKAGRERLLLSLSHVLLTSGYLMMNFNSVQLCL